VGVRPPCPGGPGAGQASWRLRLDPRSSLLAGWRPPPARDTGAIVDPTAPVGRSAGVTAGRQAPRAHRNASTPRSNTTRALLHLDCPGPSGACHRLALAVAHAVGVASGVGDPKAPADQDRSSRALARTVNPRADRPSRQRPRERRRFAAGCTSHTHHDADGHDARRRAPPGSPADGHGIRRGGLQGDRQGQRESRSQGPSAGPSTGTGQGPCHGQGRSQSAGRDARQSQGPSTSEGQNQGPQGPSGPGQTCGSAGPRRARGGTGESQAARRAASPFGAAAQQAQATRQTSGAQAAAQAPAAPATTAAAASRPASAAAATTAATATATGAGVARP
jgi:hypothetical protein